jgi:hypothetical protein
MKGQSDHTKTKMLITMKQDAESRDACSNAEALLLGARHLLIFFAD